MVILLIGVLAHSLHECLALLETVEFESFSERIEVSLIGPALDTSSVDDVSNSCLIHFFQLVHTSIVEHSKQILATIFCII